MSCVLHPSRATDRPLGGDRELPGSCLLISCKLYCTTGLAGYSGFAGVLEHRAMKRQSIQRCINFGMIAFAGDGVGNSRARQKNARGPQGASGSCFMLRLNATSLDYVSIPAFSSAHQSGKAQQPEKTPVIEPSVFPGHGLIVGGLRNDRCDHATHGQE